MRRCDDRSVMYLKASRDMQDIDCYLRITSINMTVSTPFLLLLILLRLAWAHAFIPLLSPSPRTDRLQFLLQQDSSSHSWDEGGRVSVRIEQQVENSTITTPSNAIQTWLEQHWKKGGGLPIFVVLRKNEERKRTILPLGMEETYEYHNEEPDSQSSTIRYTVSKPGPFFADMVPNSHQGTVQFQLESQSIIGSTEEQQKHDIKMIWEVEFETTRFRPLYQAVTEFTIGVAARTVAEALRPSRLMTVQATLPVETFANTNATNSVVEWVRREWLEFFWARGGGLPLPPPIPFGKVLEEGGGTARAKILRIPPWLVDTVLSTSTSNSGSSDAVYQIENPGWTTFPFLIHTHLGRARFIAKDENANAVDIVWEIEVRPFPVVAPLVEKLLEMTATTIVRNLAVHLVEPDGRVILQPPRGKAIEMGEIQLKRFGSIPKSSWVGGVLDAHLKDQRSTWDQTLSLLQPWTWGRSKNAGREGDVVTVQWTAGQIELN